MRTSKSSLLLLLLVVVVGVVVSVVADEPAQKTALCHNLLTTLHMPQLAHNPALIRPPASIKTAEV
ncbi:hypothetical protein KP509_1Z106600 [Ceratopteris richardii]|nr:hypothetical protein KP509_1Z106600 [Ceratopteris richardii]